MAESKNDLTENKKKRPNKLTNARIKKEIEFLEKMFAFSDVAVVTKIIRSYNTIIFATLP